MSGDIVLYDYWRSSAAYRVRIALNLKGLAYRSESVDLTSGAQRGSDYLARNPQGLVPALAIDGHMLTQSLAIIEYLDQTRPEPRLLPLDPALCAQARARAQVVAADIHPIANLRVLNVLRGEFRADEAAVQDWIHRWISAGFAALEAQAPQTGLLGGAAPDLSDVCLVPQMYNARRFALPLAPFPQLVRIDAALRELPAFAAAAPEAVQK
ncbi:maleylacetoacetate isomerase [Novosphingobium sp.]|uniref:maleylacetoacetate isomerase n=1 Tax=Novosphingobium sp. TaxID=1874826 RepID=UPI0035B21F46